MSKRQVIIRIQNLPRWHFMANDGYGLKCQTVPIGYGNMTAVEILNNCDPLPEKMCVNCQTLWKQKVASI